jgi:hypothetical protein
MGKKEKKKKKKTISFIKAYVVLTRHNVFDVKIVVVSHVDVKMQKRGRFIRCSDVKMQNLGKRKTLFGFYHPPQ